jgi:hypothetical protein
MSSFAGHCVPFLYIQDCSNKAGYVLWSQIWVVPWVLALLALLAAFIRRCIMISERFNTMRLLMLHFMCGVPWYVTEGSHVDMEFGPKDFVRAGGTERPLCFQHDQNLLQLSNS